MRPIQFTSLSQLIDPIPDDYAPYFRRGCVAYAYMHSKDMRIRAKFQDQQALWMQSLASALRTMDRERDNAGIYPTDVPMQGPWGANPGISNPYLIGGY